MPLSTNKDNAKLRLIIDRCSVECFADDGKFCMAKQTLADYNLPYVELYADGKTKVQLFDVKTLKPTL